MKELVFEELSLKQKIGMTLIALLSNNNEREEVVDYVVDLIKNHSLGGVWVDPGSKRFEENMRRVKEAADYPIPIFTDAGRGLGKYRMAGQIALGYTDSEELAYTFGKVNAINARKMGFSVVCCPVLDMVKTNWTCGGVDRALGSDKQRVTALAAAMVRGMHDGGVLSVCKHYPGQGESGQYIDSHMAENLSFMTKEQLLDYNLYPYVELNKMGLLDGIMTAHLKCQNIDPDFPASLSKKVIDIIRDCGFEGFALSDGLCMMGVVAKFGRWAPIPMSVEAGNDFALPFINENDLCYDALVEGYENGTLSEERLNKAVKRVLATHHKVAMLDTSAEITPEDEEKFARIDRDSIIEICDEGIPKALDRNGKYYFTILTEGSVDLNDSTKKIAVDTFYRKWFDPFKVADKLRELFPNSEVGTIPEFPTPNESQRIFNRSYGYETVFITNFSFKAYAGTEEFTPRIRSVFKAMQVSDRISTIVHFGNPYLLEDLPHIPRKIIGCCSEESVNHGLDVLAGELEARGTLNHNVKLK